MVKRRVVPGTVLDSRTWTGPVKFPEGGVMRGGAS